MDDSQKFVLNADFSIETFDNEILLYSISDSKGVYLNQTAGLVWELCDKNQSVGEIVALLEAAYPQQKESVRSDVVMAIEALIENSALIKSDG